MASTKILIVKLGYSETLDPEVGVVPSLGDVLRTTPILIALKEKYSDASISWLVSEEAKPLLLNNPLIDRVLVWNSFVPFQLMREKFDVLINLEKIPGVCALADMVDAWTKYGFRFDGQLGTFHAYEKGISIIDYIEGKRGGNSRRDHWQKVLIEMLGIKWRKQEYIIGYRPVSVEKYDIGFNFKAGSKWSNKAMPLEKWKELESRLSGYGFKVSWQEGFDDIYRYMEWINSCSLLLTHDSLGLHIALALKKKVLALFGPTASREVFFYNSGRAIYPDVECEHLPCYKTKCITGLNCMESIQLDAIINELRGLLACKPTATMAPE